MSITAFTTRYLSGLDLEAYFENESRPLNPFKMLGFLHRLAKDLNWSNGQAQAVDMGAADHSIVLEQLAGGTVESTLTAGSIIVSNVGTNLDIDIAAADQPGPLRIYNASGTPVAVRDSANGALATLAANGIVEIVSDGTTQFGFAVL